MFERYTEAARRTLFFSRDEARTCGADAIETEHLLLGLMRDSNGVIRRILASSKVSIEDIRWDIALSVVTGESAHYG